jgi:hypothetical protein
MANFHRSERWRWNAAIEQRKYGGIYGIIVAKVNIDCQWMGHEENASAWRNDSAGQLGARRRRWSLTPFRLSHTKGGIRSKKGHFRSIPVEM